MAKRKPTEKKHRRTLLEEIEHTAKAGDPHVSLSLSISITRGLYLHALYAQRDGDYASLSAYVADLIRRDKHIKNMRPPNLEAPLHQPTIPTPPEERARIGYKKTGQILCQLAMAASSMLYVPLGAVYGLIHAYGGMT